MIILDIDDNVKNFCPYCDKAQVVCREIVGMEEVTWCTVCRADLATRPASASPTIA